MQRLLDRFPWDGSLLSQVATLGGGRAVAGAVTIGAMPLLSRLYTPEAFGQLAVFVGLCLTLGPLLSMRYEEAIPLARDAAECRAIVRLAATLLVLVSLVAAAAAVTVWQLSSLPEGTLTTAMWLVMLPLALLALGSLNIVQWTLVRERRMGTVAVADIAAATSMALLRIGAAVSSAAGAGALLATWIASLFVAGATMRSAFVASLRRSPLPALPVAAVAKRYASFPRFNAPRGVIRQASQALAVFGLAALYPPIVVGMYALARQVAFTATVLVAEALRRVLMTHYADFAGRPAALRGHALRQTAQTALSSCVPLGLLYLFGEPLFEAAFGSRWAQAGVHASLLTPWLFTMLLTTPANCLLVVLGAQRVLFRVDLLVSLARLAMFVGASRVDVSAELLVAGFAWLGVLGHVVVLAVAYTRVASAASEESD